MDARATGSAGAGRWSLVRAARRGSCPRCGQPTAFEAPARLAFACEACGLDFSALERGGRLGGVLTVLVAIVLMLVALGLEAALRPPLLLQAVVWVPVTIGAVIGTLRLFKIALLHAAYEARSGNPSGLEEKPALDLPVTSGTAEPRSETVR